MFRKLEGSIRIGMATTFSSKRYPAAQTASGPPAAAPVTNGFDDAGVASRVRVVPFPWAAMVS